MADSEEVRDWVVRVIIGCDTIPQLDTALKVLVNYFEIYVYKPKHRMYDKYVILTMSPLYDTLKRREKEIKSLTKY